MAIQILSRNTNIANKELLQKLIEYLIGEWQMESGSTSAEGGPGERITFTTEARYIVHEGNQKVDSGAYRMNQQLRHIYLESEANKNAQGIRHRHGLTADDTQAG